MRYDGVDCYGLSLSMGDEDLKQGMVVKMRNGTLGMVVGNYDKQIAYFEKTNEGQTYISSCEIKHSVFPACDIVEVYAKRPPYIFFNRTLKDDKLLWKANPVLTEQEQRIKDLEDTVSKAQDQIKELKGALK